MVVPRPANSGATYSITGRFEASCAWAGAGVRGARGAGVRVVSVAAASSATTTADSATPDEDEHPTARRSTASSTRVPLKKDLLIKDFMYGSRRLVVHQCSTQHI